MDHDEIILGTISRTPSPSTALLETFGLPEDHQVLLSWRWKTPGMPRMLFVVLTGPESVAAGKLSLSSLLVRNFKQSKSTPIDFFLLL